MPFPPWFAWFLESRLRRFALDPGTLVALLPLQPDFVVVEVGVGTGIFARAVRPLVRSVIGIDLQRPMLRYAREKDASLRLVQASADALPLAPSSVDLIFLVTVLGELPSAPRALSAMHDALKPGGWLSISEHLPDPDYVGRTRVQRLCEAAGFVHLRTDGPWWSFTETFRRE